MKGTQKRQVFDYSGKDMAQFRLCVDLFGDRRERVYRLYCPYVTGYWTFGTAEEMAKSFMETFRVMRGKEAPEKVFSARRGVEDCSLKCTPDVWAGNILHTKKGSFYSAYLGFGMKDDADQNGFITLIDNDGDTRQITVSKPFDAADSLCAILREIERIYTAAHNLRERHQLFFRFQEQAKDEAGS